MPVPIFDEVSEAIRSFNDAMPSFPAKVGNLSNERRSGTWDIIYVPEDRPLEDCPMYIKVQELPHLHDLRDAALAAKDGLAEKAAKALEAFRRRP